MANLGSTSLDIGAETRVLVLTGAGVSAESGIPTFRGLGGLWETYRAEELATPEAFERDPLLVWRFYSARRKKALTCRPNPGHEALAALEARLGERFLLVTQNVDGLHRGAGHERIIELHGHLFTTRCSRCELPPFVDRELHEAHVPACPKCAANLRPHIVWFGEKLDPSHLDRVEAFLEASKGKDLLFLAAGTSGAVFPAAGMVKWAQGVGGRTVLVNADPAENGGWFETFIQGTSAEVLPRLLAP